jgi:hypothetical protein
MRFYKVFVLSSQLLKKQDKPVPIYNSISGCMCEVHLPCSTAKLPTLELKTRPQTTFRLSPARFCAPLRKRYWRTLGIKTLSITTLSKMTLNKMTLSKMTLSKTTISITTFSTQHIDTQHNSTHHGQ